jgi:hypothetical protein
MELLEHAVMGISDCRHFVLCRRRIKTSSSLWRFGGVARDGGKAYLRLSTRIIISTNVKLSLGEHTELPAASTLDAKWREWF